MVSWTCFTAQWILDRRHIHVSIDLLACCIDVRELSMIYYLTYGAGRPKCIAGGVGAGEVERYRMTLRFTNFIPREKI